MTSFSINATAKSIPKKIVTNTDLSKIMDTSDEWIKKRTGIQQRHIAYEETTTSLCTDVAEKLLKKSHTLPQDIDFIIVATMSSDYQTPSTAATIQGKIKAKNAIAFDLNAACSGFVYGIKVLNSLLESKPHSKGILIGGEVLSKLVDWKDRTTAVLFADGAAGILVTNDNPKAQLLSTNLKTYGELGKYLTAGNFSLHNPFNINRTNNPFFKMDGREVYKFATNKVPISIEKAVFDAHINLQDVKYFVLHQSNERIIRSIAKKMKLPITKFPVNINEYGNTAAASEPILLAELIETGKIKKGDLIVLSGFGGGLTTGSVVIKY